MLPNRHEESVVPSPETQALARVMLIGSLIGLCWLAMQGVHELGHVLAAKLTGGNVQRVVLHPFTISRTDVTPNPSPRPVAWSGPLFGAVCPLAVWGLATALRCSWSYLLRFFAGFCLVANGLYLAVAPLEAVGDAAVLLKLGVPLWQLVGFGTAAAPCGFLLWYGEGRHFGAAGAPVDRRHAIGTTIVFTASVITLLKFGQPG